MRRAELFSGTSEEARLNELTVHIEFISDFVVANTALFVTHGMVLSIYDFQTKAWDHTFPLIESNAHNSPVKGEGDIVESDSVYESQNYFGCDDDEIEKLVLSFIYQNSIYDLFIQYKGSYLRRLKYFNEVNKPYFEKNKLFQHEKVV
jgi:hypothetical protein